MKKKLSIIMPVYNALSFTKKTLESLAENTANDYELIIVDDCSSAKTKNYLKTVPCRLIVNPENLMVNKCWNIGTAAAKGDYICIINNDILFTPDWDKKLIEGLSEDNWITSPYHTEGEKPFKGKAKEGKLGVLGCCFVFNRDLIKTIGLFPEELKLWYGDNWLGDIVREKYGKKTLFVKDALIHHFSRRSTYELIFQKNEDVLDIIARDKIEYEKIRAAWK